MSRDPSRTGQLNTGPLAGLGSCLLPFARFILLSLAITTFARLALSLWVMDRISAVDGWGIVFLQGIRFDVVLLGLLLAVPMLVTPILCTSTTTLRFVRPVLHVLLTSAIVFIVFMEVATPQFIIEYDLRPNILFVKYLVYPREVAAMMWAGYKPQLLLGAICVPLASWLSFRFFRKSAQSMQRIPFTHAIIATPLLVFLCIVAMRSSFGHRPVNPSDVAFSTDPLVNMLPLPSAYSAIYGAYEFRREDEGIRFGNLDDARVIEIIREMSAAPADTFISDELPSLRRQASPLDKPKNLVIVLEESLGARFVGSLGGLPLTPNLDRLGKEGVWFTDMFATGTRSARGIEAVITGFLPTTAEPVVKLGGAQQGFFTIAEYLREHGYETSFIYGGSAQFDNMRRFFMGNGFEKVMDEADFENPDFAGSWGVSDEDLFREADAIFDSMPTDRPFFSLVFSVSNHSPYEYPEGRIEPYNEPAGTRENAIKYADHALGGFIEAARKSDYWKNTVFLIVADHDARVVGAELVPVNRFHIPALILGDGIAAQEIGRLTSQVDLIPTLLPLLGVTGAHPATGIDQLSAAAASVTPHALMRYDNNVAYRENDDVVIFQPERDPIQFRYREQHLQRVDHVDPVLLEHGLAHATWPLLAYRNKWYRLPSQEADLVAPGKEEGK